MLSINLLRKAFSEFNELSQKVAYKYRVRKDKVILSMLWCLIRYGARPADYDYFDFFVKSGYERNRYLTFYRYLDLVKKLDNAVFSEGGKLAEYEVYAEFIKRDWLYITKETTKETILSFLDKHQIAIIKPNKGEQGKGIKIVKRQNTEAIDLLLKEAECSNFLLEEIVQNCEEINQIVSSSLNTIRSYTFIDKDGNPHIMEIILRVGKKGSNVDNWGAGGVGYIDRYL